MSAHLGSRVSSLVDGQLDAGATERALSHVAGCRDCAGEVRAARATRRVLSHGLRDVVPAPELMSRLLAMAMPVPGASEASTSEASASEASTSVTGALRAEAQVPRAVVFAEPQLLPPRWQALCGDLPRAAQRRRRRVVTAALVLAGVAASGLFALGSRPLVAPVRSTDEAFTALVSAGRWNPGMSPAVTTASSGESSSYDHEVLEWMQAEGWPRPDALPEGLQVRALRFTGEDATVLEVDLESPIGDVVIREERGQLSPAEVADLATVTVGGAPVYVVSAKPLHLVWQSSDTVIDLVSAASLDDVLQLVSTFSVDEFDTGFQARVERGWSTLTGALS